MNTLEQIAKTISGPDGGPTDKWQHEYTDYYHKWFEPIKNEKLKILEIGMYAGASIKMWEQYFPNSTIYGIDNGRLCNPAVMNGVKSDRVISYMADQGDREQLKNFIDEHGGDFDIIIDDGSHSQRDQQVSLGMLYPHLKSGGLYVIEDVIMPTTAMDPSAWGIEDVENGSDTTFKMMIDLIKSEKLNSSHMTKEEIEYVEKNIDRDFHNIAVRIIVKGTSCFSTIKKSGGNLFDHILYRN